MLPLIAGAAALGIGLAKDAWDRHQQRKQQEKLNTQQRQQQEQLNQSNQKLAMQTWDQTNYDAQRKQLEKAGLNVGLMYGMGGGGGATTNSGAGGSISGGQAAPAGMGIQQGAELALLQAQKENIEADTHNKQIQASKTEEEIPGAAADSRNKSMNADITEATYQEQVKSLEYEMLQARGDANKKLIEGTSAVYTQNDKIEQERLRTIEMGVEIKNKEAGTELTRAQTQEVAARINKIVKEIESMGIRNINDSVDTMTKKLQQEFNTSTAAQIRQYTSIGTDILHATKGGARINNDNRKSYDNSTTNFNE